MQNELILNRKTFNENEDGNSKRTPKDDVESEDKVKEKVPERMEIETIDNEEGLSS
ncbi:10598_t:CDS:2 [Entrophospora sp. SA101]|nr:10556_t:CDS:2 [Entrophospora sp. SA101]CAJ0763741.1 10598_t:CDS:2 [Entrophospora sp. SA101]CAJ0894654.1 1546_t:CDS:2 [Entrophospora sp. SA101]